LSHITLLMLQVASTTTSGPVLPDATGPSLLRPVPPPACLAKAGEIVVCGKDADSYRLPQTAAQPDVTGLPKAEWKLFGDAKAGINTSQRNVGGFPSNAVMATIEIPF
jgi:hypothetical protein